MAEIPGYFGGGFPPETTETLSLTVNPATGIDPTRLTRFATQAEITTWGVFASIGGALSVLPNHIAHTPMITYADGTYAVSDLGDWSRFTFADGAQIIFTSASEWVRVSGTSSYAVQSVVGPPTNEITLTADPGFSANLVRSTYMHVLSGTAATQHHAVRYHSTAVFGHANRFSPLPDATSMVEYMNPAVVFEVADHLVVKGSGIVQDPLTDASAVRNIKWIGIEVKATVVGKQLIFEGCDIEFVKCRFTKLDCNFSNSRVLMETLICDAAGEFFGGRCSGSQIRTGSADASVLLRGSTGVGMFVDGRNARGLSQFWFNKGSVDDHTGPFGAWLIGRGSILVFGDNNLNGQNNSGYFVTVTAGGRVIMEDILEVPSGTGGDIILDGTAYTWIAINSAPNQDAIGSRGSVAEKQLI